MEEQIYEVEIKSMALIREGKKGFITYFKGGEHKQIIENCRYLYPQFMKPEDKPNVNITPITQEEYTERTMTGIIKQKAQMLEGTGDIREIMGD